MSSRPSETLDPPHNFTLTTEERVRAATAGPPAFMRRLRSIEDLREGIVRVLVEHCEEAREEGADVETHAREAAPLRALARLNELVSRHNRYYPVEANLPMQAGTGRLIDRTGEPWKPMAACSIDELLAVALERFRQEVEP
jgi:hypothetical protein